MACMNACEPACVDRKTHTHEQEGKEVEGERKLHDDVVLHEIATARRYFIGESRKIAYKEETCNVLKCNQGLVGGLMEGDGRDSREQRTMPGVACAAACISLLFGLFLDGCCSFSTFTMRMSI